MGSLLYRSSLDEAKRKRETHLGYSRAPLNLFRSSAPFFSFAFPLLAFSPRARRVPSPGRRGGRPAPRRGARDPAKERQKGRLYRSWGSINTERTMHIIPPSSHVWWALYSLFSEIGENYSSPSWQVIFFAMIPLHGFLPKTLERKVHSYCYKKVYLGQLMLYDNLFSFTY